MNRFFVTMAKTPSALADGAPPNAAPLFRIFLDEDGR
jgi:hypothetical protein